MAGKDQGQSRSRGREGLRAEKDQGQGHCRTSDKVGPMPGQDQRHGWTSDRVGPGIRYDQSQDRIMQIQGKKMDRVDLGLRRLIGSSPDVWGGGPSALPTIILGRCRIIVDTVKITS